MSPETARKLTPAEEVALIRKGLGHFTEKPEAKYWLNTGSPLFNGVFGSGTKGIPYGKLMELSGPESHGKTALALEIMSLMQKDGALTAWGDLEGSWDPEWARRRGVNPDSVYLFSNDLMKDGKGLRIMSAQEHFAELEDWMFRKHAENKHARMFIAEDSIAALETLGQVEGGAKGQNMRTRTDLSVFLSDSLKRWVGLCANYNATVLFINQIRMKPGVAFGDPQYTPGGNALRHYCSVRVTMRRTKGGKILKNAKIIGLQGTLTNKKNKVGGGSVEGNKIAFKMLFDGKTKFLPAEALKRDEEE